MKALVVDDDRVLLDLIAFALRREGFEVIQAYDGRMALERWRTEQPDIILLDVNMPRGEAGHSGSSLPASPLDGFTVCQRIRAESDTPVILLTVRSDDDDVVRGLSLGADDYIVKPFSPRQLVARVQAVLRRSGSQQPPSHSTSAGDLALDSSRREVVIAGKAPIGLTALETRLLERLLLHPGQILTSEDLIDQVWGAGGGDRSMLRQLVRRLRAKIDPDANQPRYIETVPGIGYGLKKQS